MLLYRKFLYAVRLLVDLIAVVASWVMAVYLSSLHARTTRYSFFHLTVLSLLLVWILSSEITHLYDDFRSRDFRYELGTVLKNIFAQVIAAAVTVAFVREHYLARVFLVSYAIILSAVLLMEKYLVHAMLKSLRLHGRNLRSVVIIGGGKTGQGFADSVRLNPHFGYRVVGFLDDKHDKELNGSYLGPISELETVLTDRRVDNVVIALPNSAFRKVEEIVNTCERFTTNVRIIPDYFNLLSAGYKLSMFGRYPLISLREVRLNEFHWRIVKRGFDTLFSVVLFLTVFWWLCPLIAVAIKLTSPGPIFFKQIREGRRNRRFTVYKFRSMIAESSDLDVNGKYQQARKSDPRITWVGKILRETDLDEIPQFWNVIKGEMSIVGPRPHPIPLDMKSKRETHQYMQRYLVKPGITGWAQIHGHRGETRTPEIMQKRINHDLWYVENWSFWLDIQIILETMWLMIKGDPEAY